MSLTLYGHPFSSYTWKVPFAARRSQKTIQPIGTLL